METDLEEAVSGPLARAAPPREIKNNRPRRQCPLDQARRIGF